MKEYKREKQNLEEELSSSEKRLKTSQQRIIALDSWLQQVSIKTPLFIKSLTIAAY
jgi:hypothetical protein